MLEPKAWTVENLITDFSRDFSAYQTKTYTVPLYTLPDLLAALREVSEANQKWYGKGTTRQFNEVLSAFKRKMEERDDS
jgi:hypothetical protein